jgi:hypothetical protein
LPSQAQKNQLELLGNHQQNHQRAVADQAVQADLVAVALRVDPADPVADPDLANPGLFRQIGFPSQTFCPYSFPTGK